MNVLLKMTEFTRTLTLDQLTVIEQDRENDDSEEPDMVTEMSSGSSNHDDEVEDDMGIFGENI